MKKKWIALLFAGTIILLINCINPIQDIINQFSKSPEIDAFTKAVRVSLPLAYAASIAMDAVNGAVVPGVTAVRIPPDSFPCNAVVKIAVDPGHPLPVGSSTVTGAMMVAGLFSDSATAVVSVFFTNTNIREGTFTVRDVAFVPVVRDTSGTMVVFASEDVNADSSMVINTKITDSLVTVKLSGIPLTLPADSSVAVNQKAWITIARRPAGGAPGSETYSLLGASQRLGVGASTTEVVQAVMLGVTMKPSVCRLNPDSGYAMIRTIKTQDSNTSSGIEMGTTVLTFKSACDGRATILLATGNYFAKTGSTVALNLDK
jgi:hypothetical protein